MRRWHIIAVVGLLTLGVSSTWAVIIKLTSLREIFTQSTYICTAKVESLAPDRPGMVLTVAGDQKGKIPVRRLAVNMKGDRFAEKDDHSGKMFKRLAKDLPVLLFVTQSQVDAKRLIAFGYTNGTWFQMLGQKDGDGYRWSFLHCETYFTRTFKGTTAELKQLATDFFEKQKAPPEPNKDEKPGYGPEVKQASGGRQPSVEKQGADAPRSLALTSGPLFSVIVGLPAGGLIGFLALLFPALFGGLPSLMKRWLPLVTAIFTTSTIFTLYSLLGDRLKGTEWAQPAVFWMCVAAVNLLCLLWGWRRSLRLVAEPPLSPRTERWTVVLFGLAGLLGLAAYWYFLPASSGKLQKLLTDMAHLGFPYLLVMSIGFWMGGLLLLARRVRPRAESESATAFPSDAVILWSMTVAGLLALVHATGPKAPAGREFGGQQAEGQRGPALERSIKLFEAPGQADIASAPAVAGNLVYVSAIQGGFAERTGAVYCLDREQIDPETKQAKPAWPKPFTFDGKMKQPLAAPIIAEGRVYIGEGWHENDGCHMFCLDAKTGELLWKFQTTSHTESTPVVAGGRVYFGAGDDGMYCLDAKTGNKFWQYPEPGDKRNGLHIDSSPFVAGDRVYCASGHSQMFQNYRVVCLASATGKKHWECDALDLPAWASPTVANDRVFVGLGNGRLNQSDPNPRGAVLCLDARDGKRQWLFDGVRDAVHTRAAADAYQLYVGSRDGHVYALDRDGKQVWKKNLGNPVVASPALATSASGMPTSVYFAAMDGTVVCLDPLTGADQWPAFDDLKKYAASVIGGLRVTVEREEKGERRRLYFTAGVNGGNNAVLYCLEDFWAK